MIVEPGAGLRDRESAEVDPGDIDSLQDAARVRGRIQTQPGSASGDEEKKDEEDAGDRPGQGRGGGRKRQRQRMAGSSGAAQPVGEIHRVSGG